MKNKLYWLYYRSFEYETWKLSGLYNMTDTIGTARLKLKYGYEVKIEPYKEKGV